MGVTVEKINKLHDLCTNINLNSRLKKREGMRCPTVTYHFLGYIIKEDDPDCPGGITVKINEDGWRGSSQDEAYNTLTWHIFPTDQDCDYKYEECLGYLERMADTLAE